MVSAYGSAIIGTYAYYGTNVEDVLHEISAYDGAIIGGIAYAYPSYEEVSPGTAISASHGSVILGVYSYEAGNIHVSTTYGDAVLGQYFCYGDTRLIVNGWGSGAFACYWSGDYTGYDVIDASITGYGALIHGVFVSGGSELSPTTLRATGHASVIRGLFPSESVGMASGAGAEQVGPGTNSENNSTKWGEGIHVLSGIPSVATNGMVWKDGDDVIIHSGGVDVNLTDLFALLP
jgi:hypothetical protein